MDSFEWWRHWLEAVLQVRICGFGSPWCFCPQSTTPQVICQGTQAASCGHIYPPLSLVDWMCFLDTDSAREHAEFAGMARRIWGCTVFDWVQACAEARQAWRRLWVLKYAAIDPCLMRVLSSDSGTVVCTPTLSPMGLLLALVVVSPPALGHFLFQNQSIICTSSH